MKAVYYSLAVFFAAAAAATIFQAGYVMTVRVRTDTDPEDAPLLVVEPREDSVALHPEFLVRGILSAVLPAAIVLLLGLSTDLGSNQTCIDHIGKIMVPADRVAPPTSE